MKSASPAGAPVARSERSMLLLVAAVQFVNVLDFMLVMPLGPDFAKDLAIPVSKLGFVGGSYTGAAAVAGLVSSRFLDRFDRRSALGVAMLGLVAGTLLASFAWNLPSLLCARVVAGCFGGPASSLALSIIADVVPAERRGKALGFVMGGFAVASVLGVPVSLELARIGGWRLPFVAVAALGLVVAGGAVFLMPALREHLSVARDSALLGAFLRERSVIFALLATFLVMMAQFSVVPNLSSFLQHNRSYPREQLGMLYLVGGSVSFITMLSVGGYVDKLGASRMSLIGTLLYVVVLALLFIYDLPAAPSMLLFTGLMTSMALRNVSLNALSSRVPRPHERARFMSLQSAGQHVAAALGAMASTAWLSELPDKRLAGMDGVAWFAISLALTLPILLELIERRVGRHANTLPQPWTAEAEVARQSLPPG